MESNYHSRGGHARAKALSPERRSEIASAAALARWSGEHRPKLTPDDRKKLRAIRTLMTVPLPEIDVVAVGFEIVNAGRALQGLEPFSKDEMERMLK